MKRTWEHVALQTELIQKQHALQQVAQQLAQQQAPKRVPPPRHQQQTVRQPPPPKEPAPRHLQTAHQASINVRPATAHMIQTTQSSNMRPPLWRGGKGQLQELKEFQEHNEQTEPQEHRSEGEPPPLREPLPVGVIAGSQHGRPSTPLAVSKAKMFSTASGQSADSSAPRSSRVSYTTKQSKQSDETSVAGRRQKQHQKPSPERSHMVAKRGQGRKRPGTAPVPQADVQALDEVLEPLNLGAFKDSLLRLGVESPADLRYVTEDDFKAMRLNVIQRRKFEELTQRFSET